MLAPLLQGRGLVGDPAQGVGEGEQVGAVDVRADAARGLGAFQQAAGVGAGCAVGGPEVLTYEEIARPEPGPARR
ncbi:hypothetical protein Pta02_36230 [Planobispora takensis]|uniref:Uncharacterized protein n=1 Tax=Planobispora takensis TaxID=1367882 RepID=A0A8J3WTW1_9ACTN|nr:hypothetical protein Pta02_36230 [Planobispora takensis]